jgi:hypothetical protein
MNVTNLNYESYNASTLTKEEGKYSTIWLNASQNYSSVHFHVYLLTTFKEIPTICCNTSKMAAK